MRVLVTTDSVGGVWQYTMELARGLPRGKVRLCLAVMGAPLTAEQREEAEALPHVTVFERPFKLEWMVGAERDLEESSRWLLQIASHFHPDVVHVNGYFHASLPWRRPVILVAHSCVPSWWEAVRGEPAPASWNQYRGWVKRGLARASTVVAPSRHMLSLLHRHYGSFEPCSVIYNGRELARAPAGARWKDPIVLGAGRVWDEGKNLRLLARAGRSLEWPVVIAGDASHPDRDGERGAEDANGARYLGRLSTAEMERWMRRAAIYCLPARYEPFGLTPLEAALAGSALVLSDIPTFREIWSGAAELVPGNDLDALVDALSRLIRDEMRRERNRAASAERARKLTRRRMAKSYLGLYRGLAAEGERQRGGSRAPAAAVNGVARCV